MENRPIGKDKSIFLLNKTNKYKINKNIIK